MKHHLLIAEAEPDLADRLAVAAREAGWEVTRSDHPADLQGQADSLLPSAIVLAAELAGDRGWALCNQLKRHPVTRHLWLVLTGAGEQIEQTFAQHRRLATRADAYQIRPYQPAALIAELAATTTQTRQEILAKLYAIREQSPPPSSLRSVLLWSLIAGAVAATITVFCLLR
jgi:DNA-binding response OmpR family regulator